MEPLLKQLRELPSRLGALPFALRILLLAGLVAAVGLGALLAISGSAGDNYQYAFTNLTPEDSSEAAAALKAAAIPFRLEAGGAALAVPAAKVYDARLLLATSGIPRGGGVGFELFDKGDLGVTEFTQKVNLRRATEGELARTIGRFSEVRSARVHLTLPERGLFKDEDRKASAAVVLNLQPGRTLGDRELAGIRHLVSSAVSGLAPDSVSIVDGRGAVLTSDNAWGEGSNTHQLKLERDLEQRVVSLLEPVVGAGAIVARVTATLDASEVRTQTETFDPDATALRSERSASANQVQESPGANGGVAGAAANQPLTPQAPATTASTGNRNNSNSQDTTRNYEVSKTTTSSIARQPRLQRISLAVIVNGVAGKPRSDVEVARLGELAKRAVGFDADRGDQMDISSQIFGEVEKGTGAEAAKTLTGEIPRWAMYAAAGVGVLVVLAILAMAMRRKGAPAPGARAPLLRPGASVAELEAEARRPYAAEALPPGTRAQAALPDPAIAVRDRARELVGVEPGRAALLLRAWIAEDPSEVPSQEVNRG